MRLKKSFRARPALNKTCREVPKNTRILNGLFGVANDGKDMEYDGEGVEDGGEGVAEMNAVEMTSVSKTGVIHTRL